ncbi:OCH1 [Scenedesmus sp. PABB004]|nr:OCH1 [Scenedesmus sp. PABB004]
MQRRARGRTDAVGGGCAAPQRRRRRHAASAAAPRAAWLACLLLAQQGLAAAVAGGAPGAGAGWQQLRALAEPAEPMAGGALAAAAPPPPQPAAVGGGAPEQPAQQLQQQDQHLAGWQVLRDATRERRRQFQAERALAWAAQQQHAAALQQQHEQLQQQQAAQQQASAQQQQQQQQQQQWPAPAGGAAGGDLATAVAAAAQFAAAPAEEQRAGGAAAAAARVPAAANEALAVGAPAADGAAAAGAAGAGVAVAGEAGADPSSGAAAGVAAAAAGPAAAAARAGAEQAEAAEAADASYDAYADNPRREVAQLPQQPDGAAAAAGEPQQHQQQHQQQLEQQLPALTAELAADVAAAGTAAAEPAAADAAAGATGSAAAAAAGGGGAAAAEGVAPGGSAPAAGSVAAGGGVAAVGPPAAWQPRVLDAPVPKWPRLYSTMAPPAPTLPREDRAAAASALIAAAAAARSPQGISSAGIPGLSLEDKLLLARLLGHEIRGAFDEAGRLDPASQAYWDRLEAQLEQHTPVKHMFESIWYKCSKLNADLLSRAASPYDMEVEALHHILAWLGLRESQLPRPGEAASFDELLSLLAGINATARLVSDPVPFLATTTAPLDRNGLPLLIHMTFKDKGAFARHHLLSLASWARENPDHAILMYDDADLEAYLRAHDPGVLPTYARLKTAVERSDLWRYVVMCRTGGVYTDADTLCVRPIQEWNAENHNDASALFGVEDVFRRDPRQAGSSGWGVSGGRFGVQFEQWTLAGAPAHPPAHARGGGRRAPGGGREGENWGILHRTGPHVWTDSVLAWMHGQGIGFHEALVPGGRLVANSTRILPGETFGCARHFFSPAARLEEVYAMHMFRGVWRKRLDSGGQPPEEAEEARHMLSAARTGF